MGCDIHAYAEVRQANGTWKKAKVKVPDDRNYTAFAILAGVRNSYGVTPISAPRGLPEDTATRDTDDTDADLDSPDHVWLGDHSHSWLLLSELMAIDYNQDVNECGMVTKRQANFIKQGFPPSSWCSWTTDPESVEAEWKRPLYESASLIPKIIAVLGALGKPEDVRLVFGFDS